MAKQKAANRNIMFSFVAFFIHGIYVLQTSLVAITTLFFLSLNKCGKEIRIESFFAKAVFPNKSNCKQFVFFKRTTITIRSSSGLTQQIFSNLHKKTLPQNKNASFLAMNPKADIGIALLSLLNEKLNYFCMIVLTNKPQEVSTGCEFPVR